MALSLGFTFSLRSNAIFKSSEAWISLFLTNAASPRPSYCTYSEKFMAFIPKANSL